MGSSERDLVEKENEALQQHGLLKGWTGSLAVMMTAKAGKDTGEFPVPVKKGCTQGWSGDAIYWVDSAIFR